jgi:uncharacterized protein (TIGR02118 family)
MIKVIAFIKRKPGISHEEFVQHYEEVHAPLAMKHLTTISRYVRNYIVAMPGTDEIDYDCITEFWYEDIEAAQASQDFVNSEAGQVIHDDEETFMDRGKMVALLVDEREFK